MKSYVVAIAVAALAIASEGKAKATCSLSDHEFSDLAIVVSDAWAAPCTGYSNLCNPGHLVNGTTCTNSWCDNMRYQCAAPPKIFDVSTSLSGNAFIVNQFDQSQGYGWTSDENGPGSTRAVCPMGYAMVGGFASNSYSDNIRTVCQQIDRAGGWGGLTLSRQSDGDHWISSNAPQTSVSHAETFLMGQSCHSGHPWDPYCGVMWMWFLNVTSP